MTIDTSREAVERLLDGVTPGPWGSRPDDEIQGAHVIHGGYYEIALFTGGYPEAAKDLAFIAAARDLVPALLASAEAAEAREQLAIRQKNSAETLLQTYRDAQKNVLNKLHSAKAERDAALAEVARLSSPPDDAEVAALVAELVEPLVIIEGYSADYVDTDDVRERIGKAADSLTRLSHAHTAERKLADDLATDLNAANVILEAVDYYTYDAALEAHAARRNEETLAKHGSKT